jgi:hypothetical protein
MYTPRVTNASPPIKARRCYDARHNVFDPNAIMSILQSNPSWPLPFLNALDGVDSLCGESTVITC